MFLNRIKLERAVIFIEGILSAVTLIFPPKIFAETFRAGANQVREDFFGNYLTILCLRNFIEKLCAACKVVVLNIIYRSYNRKTSLNVKNVNDCLNSLNIDVVNSRNVGGNCLNNSGLHLNSTVLGEPAIKFIKKMKIISKN